nr:MAG TPA: hypothetical protein [Caudoviricetes sp.]
MFIFFLFSSYEVTVFSFLLVIIYISIIYYYLYIYYIFTEGKLYSYPLPLVCIGFYRLS